ncbi:MAG: hypothetical protein ACTSSP_05295 [Candidatus Asgardarchaeia archaeon]
MIYQLFIIDKYIGTAHFIYKISQHKKIRETDQLVSGLITALNHISEYIFMERFQIIELKDKKLIITACHEKEFERIVALALVDKRDNPLAVSRISRKLIRMFVKRGYYKRYKYSFLFEEQAKRIIRGRTILRERDLSSTLFGAIISALIIFAGSFFYYRMKVPWDLINVALAALGLFFSGFCIGDKRISIYVAFAASVIVCFIFVFTNLLYAYAFNFSSVESIVAYIIVTTLMSVISVFSGSEIAEHFFLFEKVV